MAVPLVGAPDPATAIGIFIQQHREAQLEEVLGHDGSPAPLSRSELVLAWRQLPQSERDKFEAEARARRSAAAADGAGGFLRRQQQSQHLAPPVRRINPNEPPPAKRSKATAKEPPVKVPEPAFPSRPASASERPSKFREMAQSLKAQAEERGALISARSSLGVDLDKVSTRLKAPSLSCDWQAELPATLEERELGQQEEGLEVELPAGCEARTLLRQDIQQRISSAKVLQLLLRAPRQAINGAASRAAAATAVAV